jgi:hypothetical protein
MSFQAARPRGSAISNHDETALPVVSELDSTTGLVHIF